MFFIDLNAKGNNRGIRNTKLKKKLQQSQKISSEKQKKLHHVIVAGKLRKMWNGSCHVHILRMDSHSQLQRLYSFVGIELRNVNHFSNHKLQMEVFLPIISILYWSWKYTL